MKEALALFRRDVMLAWREGGTIGTALGFYLVVVAITPLGLGPDLNLLSRIAPGVLWTARSMCWPRGRCRSSLSPR